ncbi:hypothetical protein [Parathalassolituus penaei]|uniref:ATPase n=1 Tax=Parathalassolituus penaei TaxID=2997323 RepID=A0A9X3EGR5_9GAMM|nr:hypothetical protein [Parathalassolituus penaei]MCY0967277.1 hypothetical protein [Parathalassolituus penaei]
MSSSKTLLKWLDQISKIGIKTPLAGIDIGRDRNNPSDVELDLVADGLSALLKNGKPMLLVLDEVQHLATNKEFEPLVFALRGLLDSQRQHIKVLFTGSSRNGLNQLFRRRKAPLFSSSQQIDLPELGSPFLEHLNHAFLQATGRSLRLAECQAAFRQLKKVPYDYQQVLDILMRAGHTDITSITQSYLQNLDQGDEHANIWKSLKAVDQAVLCCMLEPDYQGPYTPEANRFMAERLGLDQLDTATIQNALNRLKKNNIIASVGHGRYELEDPNLADWIRYQQDSES